MRTAIVKPDHVGDLVLSSGAIRVALGRAEQPSLFVSSRNRGLATELFGSDIDIQTIDFPHLTKSIVVPAGNVDFRAFNLVMFLRNDGVLNPKWAELRCRDYVFPRDENQHHQTVFDYGVTASVFGDYDTDAFHFPTGTTAIERKAAEEPSSVGLCIGSGFHANTWPAASWHALGTTLLRQGIDVFVIGGPAEAALAYALAHSLEIGINHTIIGGNDTGEFLTKIEILDWVIASDGGTGHLCSLRVPVLSIFGPSPHRRYAPFGRWNRLLTREMLCSPCCQWMANLVNGCLSMECMGGIRPSDALIALRTHLGTFHQPGSLHLSSNVVLFEGLSHLERPNASRTLHEPGAGNELNPEANYARVDV